MRALRNGKTKFEHSKVRTKRIEKALASITKIYLDLTFKTTSWITMEIFFYSSSFTQWGITGRNLTIRNYVFLNRVDLFVSGFFYRSIRQLDNYTVERLTRFSSLVHCFCYSFSSNTGIIKVHKSCKLFSSLLNCVEIFHRVRVFICYNLRILGLRAVSRVCRILLLVLF